MRRRLFTLLAALSLMLWLASMVLWVRSYWVADVILWRGFRAHAGSGLEIRDLSVLSVEGYLRFDQSTFIMPQDLMQVRLVTAERLDAEAGLYYWSDRPHAFSPRQHDESRGIPIGLLVAVCGILPLIWLRQRRREYLRSRVGLCSVCGYDLRASKERCPECGTAIGAVTALVGVGGGPQPEGDAELPRAYD